MRYTSQKGGDERFEQLEVCHPASTGAERALCGPYPLVAVVGGEPIVAWAGGCPLCKRWQNITINGLSEQVRALNVGLDRVEGTLRFTGDLDTVNHVVDDDEDAGDAIEVPVRTLDAVLDDVRPVVFQLWISRLASTRITGAAPVRDQVGGDWGNYLRHFDQISYLSLREVLNLVDPGYYLVNWAASQIGAGIWLVNLFCAGVFTAGLIRFVRRLLDPMLALTVAVPYMITVVAMGYTRQAAAFGFMLWALVYLKDKQRPAFIITIAVAATFHQSAVLLLPLAVLATRKQRLWTAIWVGISGLVFFILFLGEQRAEQLWAAYVISEYAFASEGGPIRVLMNTLPAVVFLSFYRRFEMIREDKALWFWMAVLSLAALPLVFQAPTAVDRVALYLMPIQLVVWSYFPLLFVKRVRHLIRIGILAGYGAVLFVWLNYATHAPAWLPYRFYPLEML